jgi:hypothetical protein
VGFAFLFGIALSIYALANEAVAGESWSWARLSLNLFFGLMTLLAVPAILMFFKNLYIGVAVFLLIQVGLNYSFSIECVE